MSFEITLYLRQWDGSWRDVTFSIDDEDAGTFFEQNYRRLQLRQSHRGRVVSAIEAQRLQQRNAVCDGYVSFDTVRSEAAQPSRPSRSLSAPLLAATVLSSSSAHFTSGRAPQDGRVSEYGDFDDVASQTSTASLLSHHDGDVASLGLDSPDGYRDDQGGLLLCGECDEERPWSRPSLKGSDIVCAICLDTSDYSAAGFTPAQLPCGHRFCHPCVQQWLSSTSGPGVCPTCKRSAGDGPLPLHAGDETGPAPQAIALRAVRPTLPRRHLNPTRHVVEPLRRGLLLKRAVSATLLKTWRTRHISLYANRIEWHTREQMGPRYRNTGPPQGVLDLSGSSTVQLRPGRGRAPATLIVRSGDAELQMQSVFSEPIEAWLRDIQEVIEGAGPESAAERRGFLRHARRLHLKRCPRCSAVLEKTEGCDQMQCRCGHRFRWSAARPVVPCNRVHLCPDHSGHFAHLGAPWGRTCPGCTWTATAKLALVRAGCVTLGPPAAIAGAGLVLGVGAAVVAVPFAVFTPLAIAYQPMAWAWGEDNTMASFAVLGAALVCSFVWMSDD